jgi:hypothetical protein
MIIISDKATFLSKVQHLRHSLKYLFSKIRESTNYVITCNYYTFVLARSVNIKFGTKFIIALCDVF